MRQKSNTFCPKSQSREVNKLFFTRPDQTSDGQKYCSSFLFVGLDRLLVCDPISIEKTAKLDLRHLQETGRGWRWAMIGRSPISHARRGPIKQLQYNDTCPLHVEGRRCGCDWLRDAPESITLITHLSARAAPCTMRKTTPGRDSGLPQQREVGRRPQSHRRHRRPAPALRVPSQHPAKVADSAEASKLATKPPPAPAPAMTGATLFQAAMRRKSSAPPSDALVIEAESERPLNLVDLTLLGVGGTLGSGLFLLTGRAARVIAGPAVTLSFLVAAVACLFSALAYAEMASRNPNSGGAYAFAYTALGELPAFLVGMCLTLEYGVSSAAVARSWASYLGDALGFLPGWLTGKDTMFSVLAFALVLGVSLMLSMGLKEAKWVINSATVMYGLVVLVILIFGSRKVDTENWDPFFPFGLHGVIAGSSAVFFAYVGFDEVATLAEEAQDSARTVPLAILLSLVIVTSMYIGASLVLTGLVDYVAIDTDAPFSAAFRSVGLPIIAKLVGFGTALGMMNTTAVSMAAQPRIFMSMGRDGLLPRAFAFSTSATTVGCGIIVALLALVVQTHSLADVVSGGTLLAFLATNVALLLTRSRIHSRARRTPMLIYAFVGASAITGIVSRLVGNNELPQWLGILICLPIMLVPSAMLLISDFEGGVQYERAAPSFMCPLVPIMPMLGSFTTCFLLFQLSNKALSALCTWLALSATSYFCYGAQNAIIANSYLNLSVASPSQSYNSFDELAMEARSISSSDSPPTSPVPEQPSAPVV